MLELNTRINADIRTAIKAKAFVTSGIKEANVSLIEKRAALAEKVRQAALAACGVTEEELNRRYASLKELENFSDSGADNGIGKFICASVYRDRDRYCNVGVNGQIRYFHLNGSANGEDTHIKITAVHDGGPWVNRYRVLLSDDKLLAEVMELDAEQESLNRKTTTFDATLDAVLKNARTIKQLLTAWPDAKELLPEDIQRATGTALAINPAELNAICGIPSGK